MRNNSASVQVGQSSTPHPLAEEEEEEEEDLPSNLAAQLLAMLPANAVQGLRDTFLAQTMALSYAPVIGKAHHLVVLSPCTFSSPPFTWPRLKDIVLAAALFLVGFLLSRRVFILT